MSSSDLKETKDIQRREPLAYRMMPKTLADFIGQRHILEEGKMLWRMITADRLSSIILFGPRRRQDVHCAGDREFNKLEFPATERGDLGVADIKRIISDTENPLLTPSGRCVLY